LWSADLPRLPQSPHPEPGSRAAETPPAPGFLAGYRPVAVTRLSERHLAPCHGMRRSNGRRLDFNRWTVQDLRPVRFTCQCCRPGCAAAACCCVCIRPTTGWWGASSG